MRHYVARPPVAPLAQVAEYVWASYGAPDHAAERVVPTGTVELVVSLADGVGRIYDAGGRAHAIGGAMVAGAYRRPFTFDTHEKMAAVGIHLRPGLAGLVLGVPPGELTDRHVGLDALWGRAAGELRERLCAAGTTPERFAILEAALRSRLDAARPAHPVVGHALGRLTQPQARVADIARDAGLSQRRLIELFTAAVGVTPKRFGRIARFQRATALARRTAADWARIAHACGYYDQAHMIRDFHELADITPTELARASVHVHEHHQLAVAGR